MINVGLTWDVVQFSSKGRKKTGDEHGSGICSDGDSDGCSN